MLVKLVGKVRLFVALQSHREKWKLRFYVGMRQNFVMFLLNQINFAWRIVSVPVTIGLYAMFSKIFPAELGLLFKPCDSSGCRCCSL